MFKLSKSDKRRKKISLGIIKNCRDDHVDQYKSKSEPIGDPNTNVFVPLNFFLIFNPALAVS